MSQPRQHVCWQALALQRKRPRVDDLDGDVVFRFRELLVFLRVCFDDRPGLVVDGDDEARLDPEGGQGGVIHAHSEVVADRQDSAVDLSETVEDFHV